MCCDGVVTTDPAIDNSADSLDTGADPRSADPLALVTVARHIAERAATHVRTRRPEVFGDVGVQIRGSATSVASKSTPTDPVTVVDTETEALLRELLARHRPFDSILGEEGGGDGSTVDGVRWVLDPIDGTVNFLYGIPAYAVSVAAQVDGVSVAGVVVDVAGRLEYSAVQGGGAWVADADGTRTSLSAAPVTEVSMALLATGFGYGSGRRTVQGALMATLLPRVRDIRRIGSAALDLCMVASGRVDAHFEHGLSPWDWAAGSLIASEAGAVVRLPSPQSTSSEGAVTVAVAPGIATEFLELLEGSGALNPIPARAEP